MGDVANILDELKRVASTGPGNLQAADAVMKSTPKMLIEYVTEHVAEMNKNRCGVTLGALLASCSDFTAVLIAVVPPRLPKRWVGGAQPAACLMPGWRRL